jgi:L-ascorbate metabolism protein UlaG (beta-lactamase superfamily)
MKFGLNWKKNNPMQFFSFVIYSLFLLSLNSCGSTKKEFIYKLSDHYDGKVFSNPWGNNNHKNLFDVMKWKIESKRAPWPENEIINSASPQLVHTNQAASIHITFIGHSTFYIQNEKYSILTDPQFSERASPLSFIGPKRIRKPGLDIEKLPRVDYVIISHNHYDHLDLPSLKKLHELYHPTFIVPVGNAPLLNDLGIKNITELDWWETFEGITLVPVQHWSQRGLFDKNKSLWGGYVFSLSDKKIFFAGDTGYGPHFKMIHERLGGMDISLLPIGAYEPQWFMKDQHLNPREAVQAHIDLKTKKSIAIHFETFQMSDESFSAPRESLIEELKSRYLPAHTFWIPQVGETLILDN